MSSRYALSLPMCAGPMLVRCTPPPHAFSAWAAACWIAWIVLGLTVPRTISMSCATNWVHVIGTGRSRRSVPEPNACSFARRALSAAFLVTTPTRPSDSEYRLPSVPNHRSVQ
ncbi:MAG: hypothetical protein KF745_02880 [Phycisphaeraceae bacterium]|nr:hypothetical protein [Phycisphaeraceae bacterium]